MKFPTFEMERMQSAWEHRVRYDLSESGVEPVTFAEILLIAGGSAPHPTPGPSDAAQQIFHPRVADLRLGYADGRGREETRGLIAGLHLGASADDVLVTTGTSEANFLALTTLVERGDEVVVVLPNYMQVHGLARGVGANVREVWLHEDEAWRLDLDRLRSAVTAKTKLICICTPNNPTGQVLTAAELEEVVAIARRHGAWILSDEVYRGAEHDGVESASAYGRYERVVVTGGLSKAYGLPGLRIGWIVAPRERIDDAWAQKDYTTIAVATVSDLLAEVALERRGDLLARTRGILRARWPVLEDWARMHERRLHWTKPQAGAICFFGYSYDVDSWPFVDQLIRARSTMVVPGSHFLSERHLRIGFGGPQPALLAGLVEIDAAFAELAVAR